MAISTKKKTFITKNDVLSIISDYDIFRMYIGDFVVGRKFCNSYRQEKNPSAIIRMVDGKLWMTDYGDEDFCGDAFNLVMKINSCNFYEAIRIIDRDFNLGLFSEAIGKKPVTFKKPEIREKKSCKIFTSPLDYSEEGKKFFAQYHLTLEDMNFCKDTTVGYINELVVDYRREYIGKLAIEYKLKNWKKIYRPYANKENKWRSNIPSNEFFGLSCLGNTDTLIITKALKDAALIKKYIGLDCIVPQSENPSFFSDNIIDLLNSKAKNIYVNFDSDSAGKRASTILTKKTGWKHINCPDKYLKENIKDFSDMVSIHGVDVLLNFFKEKRII